MVEVGCCGSAAAPFVESVVGRSLWFGRSVLVGRFDLIYTLDRYGCSMGKHKL